MDPLPLDTQPGLRGTSYPGASAIRLLQALYWSRIVAEFQSMIGKGEKTTQVKKIVSPANFHYKNQLNFGSSWTNSTYMS